MLSCRRSEGIPWQVQRSTSSGSALASPSPRHWRLVADLEIADRLAAGERSVDDLAVESLYRVMRLLAAEGVFRETSPRRFGLAEVGEALRSDGAPVPAT
jgi:hypothetical protein